MPYGLPKFLGFLGFAPSRRVFRDFRLITWRLSEFRLLELIFALRWDLSPELASALNTSSVL